MSCSVARLTCKFLSSKIARPKLTAAVVTSSQEAKPNGKSWKRGADDSSWPTEEAKTVRDDGDKQEYSHGISDDHILSACVQLLRHLRDQCC